jgi:GNAT superfamily N-acetyltransferase
VAGNPHESGVIVRAMTPGDAAAVLAVQQIAYPPSHHEDWAVLARKLQLWPAGCWVAQQDDELLGYLFSHPGRLNAPPLLHAALDGLPARPDAYALHDLALRPQAQGRGLGRLLFERVLQQAAAAGLPAISLVAVQGSAAFWARLGFEPVLPAPPQLASYGGDAVFMQRPAMAACAAPERGAAPPAPLLR